MPAQSQAQRRWAFGVMGPAWARKHHFDTPGKLPKFARGVRGYQAGTNKVEPQANQQAVPGADPLLQAPASAQFSTGGLPATGSQPTVRPPIGMIPTPTGTLPTSGPFGPGSQMYADQMRSQPSIPSAASASIGMIPAPAGMDPALSQPPSSPVAGIPSGGFPLPALLPAPRLSVPGMQQLPPGLAQLQATGRFPQGLQGRAFPGQASAQRGYQEGTSDAEEFIPVEPDILPGNEDRYDDVGGGYDLNAPVGPETLPYDLDLRGRDPYGEYTRPGQDVYPRRPYEPRQLPTYSSYGEGTRTASDDNLNQALDRALDRAEQGKGGKRKNPHKDYVADFLGTRGRGTGFDPMKMLYTPPRRAPYQPKYVEVAKGKADIKADNRIQKLLETYNEGIESTDSVPAMLTPHEAVLNVKAADLLGRDNIARLNAAGNRMTGKRAGPRNVGGVPGYAGGYPTYDDRGNLIEGATPSWYTSTRLSAGPEGTIDFSPSADPDIEPTPIPSPDAGSPSTSAGGGDIGTPPMDIPLVPPPGLPKLPPGPIWYPGANLPPVVKMILGTNPYYNAIKVGFSAPQYAWRAGGSIGNLLKKLFPGGGGGSDSGGGGEGGVKVGDPSVVEWAGGGGDKTGGGGGFDFSKMFGGLPEGFTETGRFGEGAPSFTGPGGNPNTSWIGGSAFGHPVGNLATAIGFGGPYGGGSAINYGGTGWGNSLARGQLLRLMKGIYTSPGAYGAGQHANSPLNALSGTGAPSYAAFHQGQVELANILRSNPSLLLGMTSGVVPRGTPMKSVT